MTRRLLEWTTGRPLTVAILALLMGSLGVWSFLNLQIDAIPDITGVQVQINTTVPALAPEEIERLVTLPIERSMGGQPGLREMRSLTKTGLSQVTLIYEDGTDQLRARQFVNGDTPILPVGAKYVLIFLMFAGRTGSMTVAAALALRERSRVILMPEERPIIGCLFGRLVCWLARRLAAWRR